MTAMVVVAGGRLVSASKAALAISRVLVLQVLPRRGRLSLAVSRQSRVDAVRYIVHTTRLGPSQNGVSPDLTTCGGSRLVGGLVINGLSLASQEVSTFLSSCRTAASAVASVLQIGYGVQQPKAATTALAAPATQIRMESGEAAAKGHGQVRAFPKHVSGAASLVGAYLAATGRLIT